MLAMDVDSDAEEDSNLEMECDAQDGRDEQRVDSEVPEKGRSMAPYIQTLESMGQRIQR